MKLGSFILSSLTAKFIGFCLFCFLCFLAWCRHSIYVFWLSALSVFWINVFLLVLFTPVLWQAEANEEHRFLDSQSAVLCLPRPWSRWAEISFCPGLPPPSSIPLLLPAHRLPVAALEGFLSSGLPSGPLFLALSLIPCTFLGATCKHLGNHFPISETAPLPHPQILWMQSSAITPYNLPLSPHCILMHLKGLKATDYSNLKRVLFSNFFLSFFFSFFLGGVVIFPPGLCGKFFLLHYFYHFVFHFIILLQHRNYTSCCGDIKCIANNRGLFL